MADKAKPIPDGFHTLTPHLTVRDAAKAIEFYKQAFGAEVRGVVHEGKKVMHAALKIGDSMLMLNDEFPEWGTLSPLSTGNADAGVAIHIYVEDVDNVFNRAVSAGATVKMPPMDQFWGDRYGQVVDLATCLTKKCARPGSKHFRGCLSQPDDLRGSISQQDSQVTQIIASRASNDCVA